MLRPLAGTSDEVITIHRLLSDLLGGTYPEERISASNFPPPTAENIQDAASAALLWNAARLILREGATPFRSLGRISIRPRLYQLVPLLMALRLDPVRLFIADDVGVGKTIEALLIARELWDRGTIRRMAILCPPYLCDQWEKELREKFNFDPVVLTTSTIAQLERQTPPDQTIYEYYPVQVLSIDWVKSDRNRYLFLNHCPEFVIVDEAHGAAEAAPRNKGQQQRHRLLRDIAQDPSRHLLLLTATPHSGIETAFRSLLALLRPEFAQWDATDFQDPQKRQKLAIHFIQRTRKDVENLWKEALCFPKRISRDATYTLSPKYRTLYQKTYNFCFAIIKTGENLEQQKRRVRYWGALALLRAVMSSPAAAVAALRKRINNARPDEAESDFAPYILESSETVTEDEPPTPAVEKLESQLQKSEQQILRSLYRDAYAILGTEHDTKLLTCREEIRKLLAEGFHPIVWCRYVATAVYVGKHLQQLREEDPALRDLQVLTITGRMAEEERRAKIASIDPNFPRILVATDCLSEGVNLQEKFTAVLHYDLPWNPNRLEQREGRVDRYGQPAEQVVAIRFYGKDNPIDGAVLEVLLRKAKEIYEALGTFVPIPENTETVIEAIVNSLFLRNRHGEQLSLLETNPVLEQLHTEWEAEMERERRFRSHFAMEMTQPAEVKKLLDQVDAVLGSPDTVREFLLTASQRLGLPIKTVDRSRDLYALHLSASRLQLLPDPIRSVLPSLSRKPWLITFTSPTPAEATYIGRNHPLIATLAQFILEQAIEQPQHAIASRTGVIRTTAVSVLTTLLLLRVRYLLQFPQQPPLLAEEALITGYRSPWLDPSPGLTPQQSLDLLYASPTGNIPISEKRELIENALYELEGWQTFQPKHQSSAAIFDHLRTTIEQRAKELERQYVQLQQELHQKIEGLTLTPQFPPDLLGILVLQPQVRR